MIASRGRTLTVTVAGIAALALAGCGGSGAKPSSYVKSMCVALGNWRNTIQGAEAALGSSGASSASRPVAKLDYQRFVTSVVIATRRATNALRSAGFPSVKHGQQLAQRLERAFQRATRGLQAASAQAKGIRTDSNSTFQLGLSAVDAEIRSALAPIASASPGRSPELRSAAAKQPACQLLTG